MRVLGVERDVARFYCGCLDDEVRTTIWKLLKSSSEDYAL